MTFTRRRLDFLVVTGLLLLAAVLRFWNLSHLGLTHFDEGSYTMAGRWLATWGREGWFFQAGQAPGLFPSLVGASLWLFGMHDTAAIAVSVVAGALTVGLVYWIGLNWFDRRVGVLAALFLATCEYHLIYSRMALTDATFCLLFWAALAALWAGVQQRRRNAYWLGGFLTGLAWNTKYHGFFPLVIMGIWLAGKSLLEWRRGGRLLDAMQLPNLAWAGSIAALAYLPWFLSVVFTVGYESVLRGQLEHSLMRGGLLVTHPATFYFYLTHWASLPLLILAGAGLIMLLLDGRPASRFLILVVAFFSGSLLLYLSFPRLLLPIIPALCLFAARALTWLSDRARRRSRAFLIAGSALVVLWNLADARQVLLLRTDSYREAAAYLETFPEPVLSQLNKNFYFYEGRKKSLELRWQDREELERLVGISPSVIVAVDPIIQRLEAPLSWFERHRPEMELLRSFEVRMYEPVYYQGFDPWIGFDNLPRSIAPAVPGRTRIEVYRLPRQ